MGSKGKRYKPSAEEVALQKSQLEEMASKDSEIAEAKHRRHQGSRKRSLMSHMQPQQKQTLGA